MCVYSDDGPQIYDRRTVKHARKQHKCEECRRVIEVGESYDYVFAVYDDDPATFKTCAGCALGMEWLRVNCNGFMHGDVEPELREHFDGEEQGIWDGSYKPEYTGEHWQPTRSRLWLGMVLVGMNNQWRIGNVERLAAVDTVARGDR